jgi:hypothetical protein
MKVEGYNEFILTSAFDHLMGDKKVARAFLANNVEFKIFSKAMKVRICVLSYSKILIKLTWMVVH